MKNWYKPLEKRYKDFPKDIQILNMVSDLTKAKNLASTAPDLSRKHLYMALILLDYIIDDPKWKNELGELRRLREAVASLLEGPAYGTFENIINASLAMDIYAYRKLIPDRKQSEGAG